MACLNQQRTPEPKAFHRDGMFLLFRGLLSIWGFGFLPCQHTINYPSTPPSAHQPIAAHGYASTLSTSAKSCSWLRQHPQHISQKLLMAMPAHHPQHISQKLLMALMAMQAQHHLAGHAKYNSCCAGCKA